ncbi:MAG: hypothetical protein IT258_03640, partial [Saprospiraceae bacterium]|nr:hypothetical protein [Saprospiraceae bacterium]
MFSAIRFEAIKFKYFLAVSFYLFLQTALFAQNEPTWMHFTGSDNITGLEFRGDTAWIASAGGLALYSISQNSLLAAYNAGNSDIGKNTVASMAVGHNGDAWVNINTNPYSDEPELKYFDGSNFIPAASNLELLDQALRFENLSVAPNGDLYFTEQLNDGSNLIKLWKLSAGLLEQVLIPDTLVAAEVMIVAEDGKVWLGFNDSKIGSYDGTDWTIYKMNSVISATIYGYGKFQNGPNNTLYLQISATGVDDSRLLRYANGQWTDMPNWPGWPAIDFDADGVMYVLNGGKLTKYDNGTYTDVFYFSPVGTGYFIDYKFAPDGEAWTLFQPQWQNFNQMYAMDGSTAQPIRFGNSPLPSNITTQTAIDANGEKIILSGLEAWRFNGTDWSNIPGVEVDAPSETRALPDLNGNVWFLITYSNFIQWLHNGTVNNFPIAINPPHNAAIHPIDNRMIYDDEFSPFYQTMDTTGVNSNSEITSFVSLFLFDSTGAAWAFLDDWTNDGPRRWNESEWEVIPMPFAFPGDGKSLAYIDDAQKVYFMGDQSGQLAIYDQATGTWENMEDGANNFLRSSSHLRKDSKNNLWVLSYEGLFKYD